MTSSSIGDITTTTVPGVARRRTRWRTTSAGAAGADRGQRAEQHPVMTRAGAVPHRLPGPADHPERDPVAGVAEVLGQRRCPTDGEVETARLAVHAAGVAVVRQCVDHDQHPAVLLGAGADDVQVAGAQGDAPVDAAQTVARHEGPDARELAAAADPTRAVRPDEALRLRHLRARVEGCSARQRVQHRRRQLHRPPAPRGPRGRQRDELVGRAARSPPARAHLQAQRVLPLRPEPPDQPVARVQGDVRRLAADPGHLLDLVDLGQVQARAGALTLVQGEVVEAERRGRLAARHADQSHRGADRQRRGEDDQHRVAEHHGHREAGAGHQHAAAQRGRGPPVPDPRAATTGLSGHGTPRAWPASAPSPARRRRCAGPMRRSSRARASP